MRYMTVSRKASFLVVGASLFVLYALKAYLRRDSIGKPVDSRDNFRN